MNTPETQWSQNDQLNFEHVMKKEYITFFDDMDAYPSTPEIILKYYEDIITTFVKNPKQAKQMLVVYDVLMNSKADSYPEALVIFGHALEQTIWELKGIIEHLWIDEEKEKQMDPLLAKYNLNKWRLGKILKSLKEFFANHNIKKTHNQLKEYHQAITEKIKQAQVMILTKWL